jgi:hypothetical protein
MRDGGSSRLFVGDRWQEVNYIGRPASKSGSRRPVDRRTFFRRRPSFGRPRAVRGLRPLHGLTAFPIGDLKVSPCAASNSAQMFNPSG